MPELIKIETVSDVIEIDSGRLEVTTGERGPRGPQGEPGQSTLTPFEYLMPVAQTTATFAHTLGRDPVSVQVLVDGVQADEYQVLYPVPGEQVRVGFDIPVQALIRLL